MNYLTLLTLFQRKIKVTFVDAVSGQVIFIKNIYEQQLPESFDKPLTLLLDGEEWQVTDAVPFHVDDFHFTKKLTLRVLRKAEFDASNKKSVLPTLAGHSPAFTTNIITDGFILDITQKEWLQIQFLPDELLPLIEEELMHINTILAPGLGARNLQGYENVHHRNNISAGSLSIPIDEFCTLISPLTRGFIRYGNNGIVENGFAMQSDNHTYYGIALNGIIKELCLQKFEGVDDEFVNITDTWQISLADWCNGQVISLKSSDLM